MTIPLDLRAVKTARAYPEDALRVAPANAAVILLRSSAGVLLILGM
ncbi:MAG: hypothetical protein QN189_10185 [Armatimonadota bacterium]|nr:hypothetical protein [Armatimonadota bacterium]